MAVVKINWAVARMCAASLPHPAGDVTYATLDFSAPLPTSRLPLSDGTLPAKGTTSAVTLHSGGADTFHLAFPSHSIQERR